MINTAINILQQDFAKGREELEVLRSTIQILASTSTQFNDTDLREDINAVGNYSLFLSYIFYHNPKINVQEEIEKYKDFEVEINSLKEHDFLSILNSVKNNQMSVVYLNPTYLQLYNYLKEKFDNQGIIEVLRLFVGYNHAKNTFLSTVKSVRNSEAIEVDFEKINMTEELSDFINKLISKINELKAELKKKAYRLKKIAEEYPLMEEKLTNNDREPMMSISERGKNLYSLEFMYVLHQIVLQNQINHKIDLELQLSEFIPKDDKNKMANALKKYGVSLDGFTNPNIIIEKCDYENVTGILKEMKSSGINLKDLVENGLDKILCYSSVSIVSNIMRLLNNGVVTIEFIKNNPQIFFDNLEQNNYSNLCENAELFKREKIDFKNPNYNPNVLLRKSSLNKLIRDLSISYQIKDIELYDNPKVFSLVDLLIELNIDYSQLVLENINGYDIDLIRKRIILASSLGMDIIINNKLNKDLVTGDKFLTTDEDLDEYIIDETKLTIPEEILNKLNNNPKLILTDLEELKIIEDYLDDQVYNIEGINISKNKVLRIKKALDSEKIEENNKIFYAIIYNSFLNPNEIRKLEGLVYSKQYEKE